MKLASQIFQFRPKDI